MRLPGNVPAPRLTERERIIYDAVENDGRSCREIAKEQKVTQERVRLVLLKARAKVEQIAAISALRAQVARLSAEAEALRGALLDAEASWSFDNAQRHTHTWHEREDWRERHLPVLKATRAALAARDSEPKEGTDG